LAGLIRIIQLTETISTPLPFSSPPVVPSAPPPASAEEALTDVISNRDPTCIEEFCSVRGGSAPTICSQEATNKIPQCPTQPRSNVDPRSIPIASRPYFTGGANNFIKHAGGSKKHIYVDVRSLIVISDPSQVPSFFLRQFTELQDPLEPFIFPGRLAPVYEWPIDIPPTWATNYKERVEELREERRKFEILYEATTRSLTKEQIAECLRPHITLQKRISEGSSQLSPVKVDRIYFWSRLHPNWNPLLKPIEATFIRGAIYAFYGTNKPEKAEELERLLRTPHYDDWEVRELVSLGALDNEFREEEALSIFQLLDDEHWEFHANEEAFRNAATRIGEVMDEMEDGELREKTGHADRPDNQSSNCSTSAGAHSPPCHDYIDCGSFRIGG
jgi:hypothetical protein